MIIEFLLLNRRKMNMTFVRDIPSVKDVRVISFASCFSLVSMCSKEISGTGTIIQEAGMIFQEPVPGASFSSKMKLLRR